MTANTTANHLLEVLIARRIRAGGIWSADDITSNGQLTLDGGQHLPNNKQNAIGRLFLALSKQGIIEWTGEVIRSKAPTRRGGMIRVWRATPKGEIWARSTSRQQ